ncbi:alpha-L-rhamnosidase [Gracilibacillus ureilyticus]|uniref:Alpha-L-rhamnosidase n=1 Tax=Gracilibacillus ureilyticus TaxID=531814 RepID=A0A1H9N152_9BACI|nr:alpha-L-rhamnosidase C-terminal domain-containing protein [Gracilibacillus ureilyticus]SER29395.1 alpha-L-rhamnosidase [Gracilibacillus ureilyticus]
MKKIAFGKKDSRIREYITPENILWKTDDNHSEVKNEQLLLEDRESQVLITPENPVVMRHEGNSPAILLDFGRELHGGIQLAVWNIVKSGQLIKSAKIRVRFGESAMEAMSEIGGETNATNDHAIRDQIVDISFLGMNEIGNTGFRFVRIDLLESDCFIQINTIKAIFIHRDLEFQGSFHSNDKLLNQIWDTGAYTVYLNMQDYLWDGIKRDRMVWIGDMHPEVSTIQAVFGNQPIVPESLDYVRDRTPLPQWMNTFPSYSAWWIIIQYDWFMYSGDEKYLREQKDYLIGLLDQMGEHIEDDGTNTMPNPFLDWPSVHNEQGVTSGVHALFILAVKKGAFLCEYLQETEAGKRCKRYLDKLIKRNTKHGNSKQAAALLALAGVIDAKTVNQQVISVDGAKRMSTFYGYYILLAKAMAEDITDTLQIIREYWGGMLKLGATTFWEDFNIEWLSNAARIHEIPPDNKVNVHGEYGDHCYVGYRHSLCHGWSSGPTAWLSRYVLGVEIVDPGCRRIKIAPSLGDLEWVEGTFPTPYGNIYVKHEKQLDGSIHSIIDAPDEVHILK